MELIGLYLIATGLLVVAGIAKMLSPNDTARALSELVPAQARSLLSLSRLRAGIRAGAALEVVIGLVALTFPNPVSAALVASSYAVFAGVVLYARSRGGALASCGCFGRADTPATILHALIDLVFAIACISVAAGTPEGRTIIGVLGHEPAAGIPLVFVSAVGLYLAYLALSMLPALEGVRRQLRHQRVAV
jgi:hypothetical protein